MRRILLLPVLLATLAVVVACSGNGHGKPSAVASRGGPDQAAQFAGCMRQHGQNVPDPAPGNNNYTIGAPSGGPNAAWEAAMQACRHFLPDGGVPQRPTDKELDGLRKYAQCMRAHGIEVTDPDPSTGKSKIQGRLANASRDQINSDPGYQAARAACQDKLLNGGQG
jgi:hypothetical protein